MKPITGLLQTEIAARLNVSRQAVNRMAHKHAWRVIGRVGRTCLYAPEDVERTLRQRGKK